MGERVLVVAGGLPIVAGVRANGPVRPQADRCYPRPASLMRADGDSDGGRDGVTKRARGSARRQPGRPPARQNQPRGGRSADQRPIRSAVPSQLDAAAEIADDVVDGRPAEAADELRRARRSTEARSRTRPSDLLAARAATE